MTSAQEDGPIAVVTGASSGIGEATARLLAQNGFRVYGASRRRRSDEHGVQMLRLDVRSDKSVKRCVDEVMARAGRIDVLVSNAGVMHEGFAEETTIEGAEAILATNLFGTVRMVNAVLPGMRARRAGRIINVGSLAEWVGEPGEGFYAASKAALARYTEALRHEVWHLGVEVCLVEPGAFTTNVLQSASASANTIADYDEPRQTASETLRQGLRRGDDPRKVATLILKVAGARSPRGRHGVGRDGRWLPYAKVLLPQRLFDFLLRRRFGLPARGRV